MASHWGHPFPTSLSPDQFSPIRDWSAVSKNIDISAVGNFAKIWSKSVCSQLLSYYIFKMSSVVYFSVLIYKFHFGFCRISTRQQTDIVGKQTKYIAAFAGLNQLYTMYIYPSESYQLHGYLLY